MPPSYLQPSPPLRTSPAAAKTILSLIFQAQFHKFRQFESHLRPKQGAHHRSYSFSSSKILASNHYQHRAYLPLSLPASSSSFSILARVTKISAARKSYSISASRWPDNFFVSHTPTSQAEQDTTATVFSSSPLSATKPDTLENSETSRNQLPHRVRRAQIRQRRSSLNNKFALASGNSANDRIGDGPDSLPPDASALLGAAAARAPVSSLKRTLSALLSLAKPRLTVLVVLSAMASYALYPSPELLSSVSSTSSHDAGAEENVPSLSPLTLLFLTTGTTLCSASANALNMLYEPRTDALMTRTRNRPLVRSLVTPHAAAAFALACAVLGVGGLYVGVNPTVAGLGAANIFLYAGAYTPLKRISAFNTWVGAVVGGIPPLMGWAAAAGETAAGDGSWRELLFNFPELFTATTNKTSSSHASPGSDFIIANETSSTGGWLLASLLFAWQFPHFMALSWPIRDEYRRAGLRMLCWVHPARNSRVALRYALAFFPICMGLCAVGVTEWTFAATSTPVNVWLSYKAYLFWRAGWGSAPVAAAGGTAATARGLFWASVWHLPVLMVLALAQKKGMWSRVWMSVFGEERDETMEDEHEWEYLDEIDGKEKDNIIKAHKNNISSNMNKVDSN